MFRFRSICAGLVGLLVVFTNVAAMGAEIQIEIPFAQPELERAAPGARLPARARRANQKLCEEYGCVMLGEDRGRSAQDERATTRRKMRDGQTALAIPGSEPFGYALSTTDGGCYVPPETPVVIVPPRNSSEGSVSVRGGIDCGLIVRSNSVGSNPTGGKVRRVRAPRFYKWHERGRVPGQDSSATGGKEFHQSVDFDDPAGICLWSCINPNPPPPAPPRPICLGSNYYRCDCRQISTNVTGWVAAVVKEWSRGYWQAGAVAKQDWSSDYNRFIQCSIPSGYPYYKTAVRVNDIQRWGWELQPPSDSTDSWGWTALLQAGIIPVRKVMNDTWAFTRYHFYLWAGPFNGVVHFWYNYAEAYFDAWPSSKFTFDYKECKLYGEIGGIIGNYFSCDYYIRGW